MPYQVAIVTLDERRARDRRASRASASRLTIALSLTEHPRRCSVFQEKRMKLAERMDRIRVESAFEVLVRARALEATGRSVIHLEIGEPDFPTPRAHRGGGQEGARRGLDALRSHAGLSGTARGDRGAYLARRAAFQVGPEHVCVVPGGKPIIFFPMMALLEPGDEVIYPNPGFPIYESMIQFLGATPVPIPLLEERGFSFDLECAARQPHRQDEDADAQFAAESDRRRDSARTTSAPSPTWCAIAT